MNFPGPKEIVGRFEADLDGIQNQPEKRKGSLNVALAAEVQAVTLVLCTGLLSRIVESRCEGAGRVPRKVMRAVLEEFKLQTIEALGQAAQLRFSYELEGSQTGNKSAPGG